MSRSTENVFSTIQDLVHALAGADMTLQVAYENGWIEQLDLLDPTKPLLRRDVARIIHTYMCSVLHEKDAVDITPSYILKDLYDCRVCAGHIMQVYTKGIMESIEVLPGLFVFGLRESVTKEELQLIVGRAFNPANRILQKRFNHF